MQTQWIWPSPGGIADMSQSDRTLGDGRLASAAGVWRARKEQLKNDRSLRDFNERLAREFAIETNVIECVFDLDWGATQALVAAGIKASLLSYGSTDKPPAYVIKVLEDALEAQSWMVDRFNVNEQPITAGSINELHALLTRSQLTTDGVTSDNYTRPTTQLLLHFHCRGLEFLGVGVVAAVFEIIDASIDEGPATRESIEIAREPFEFYHTDSSDQAAKRFLVWIEEVLTLALAQTQRML